MRWHIIKYCPGSQTAFPMPLTLGVCLTDAGLYKAPAALPCSAGRFVLTFPFPSDQLPKVTSSLAAFPLNGKILPFCKSGVCSKQFESKFGPSCDREGVPHCVLSPRADWGLNPRSRTLTRTPSHQEIHWQKIVGENESPCDTFRKFFSLHLCSWKCVSCSWILLNPVKFVSFLLPVCKNHSVFCKT